MTRTLLVVALFSCSGATAVSPDAAVLQAVVSDPHFALWLSNCEHAISIADTTSPPAYEGADEIPYFFTDEIPATSASARLRNREKVRLPRLRYPAGIRVRPLTDDDDASPFAWLSVPAFDAAAQRAAVSVARRNVSEGCPGAGYTVLLRRSGNVWQVDRRLGEWVH